MKDNIIDQKLLIAEIGTGDAANAAVEYAMTRLTYLVCGVIRGIEERDASQIDEYGSQLKKLTSSLYAERMTSLVDDILHLAARRLFHDLSDCLVVLLAMNKTLSQELSSLTPN